MKAVAFNGSPRKNWNTAMLLEKGLEGAASRGAETKLFHLYDYVYSGCKSCLACKQPQMTKKHCVINDALTPLLEKAWDADVLILGTPVYYFGETGMFRSFIERLMYPFSSYDANTTTHFPRKVPSAIIYTMNIDEKTLHEGHPMLPGLTMTSPKFLQVFMTRILGPCTPMFACDTMQVEDYAKYDMSRFDPAAKRASRKNRFPEDSQKAYQLGAELIKPA